MLVYCRVTLSPSAWNSPVPIYTPGWREALWELGVLFKNTTQFSRLDAEWSALTMRPPRLHKLNYKERAIWPDQVTTSKAKILIKELRNVSESTWLSSGIMKQKWSDTNLVFVQTYLGNGTFARSGHMGQALKASDTLEHQLMVWQVPYACAKPYHSGSGPPVPYTCAKPYHPGSGKHKEPRSNPARLSFVLEVSQCNSSY